MRCVEPFVKAGEVYSCGKCLPCQFKKRREWSRRIMLEASQHDHSSVVTLTYDEAALPISEELQPEHLRNWLKRYRKRALERYPWRRLRFYAVGEYGERTQRPHYHVVLFGQPGCEVGRSSRQWCGDCSCVVCSDVASTWSLGASSIDVLTQRSAAYVAGYVTRKVLKTSTDKLKPFTRMSNQQGIGASAMWDIASTMLHYSCPAPIGLGRYLRSKLHEYSQRELPPFAPTTAMLNVRATAYALSRSQSGIYREINEVYASQLEQREALKEKAL